MIGRNFFWLCAFAYVALFNKPALSERIQLKPAGGVYMLPVQLNDTVTIPFVLDSGAAEVSIPADILSVLRRAGTINDGDFIGYGTYTLAGGSTVSSKRYIIHKMKVGSEIVKDIVANVVSVKGDPLLGQSFLEKLPSWTLDNAAHALVIEQATRARDEHDNNNISADRKATVLAPPPPRSERKGTPLQELFSFDMLNIRIPFLESRIGVARRVYTLAGEQVREYKIDGCDVTAYVQNNNVIGYGLILGGRERWRSAKEDCNVAIPGTDHLRTNNLTLGKFVSANGLGLAGPKQIFRSACIYMCGNAADPTVELHWEGPHAVGFLNIDLVSIIAYGPSLDAADRWRNLMMKREGQEYVTDARFNCDAKYQQAGLQLFQNVEVYKLTIRTAPRPQDAFCNRTLLSGQRR